jgi:hypothetical protein
MRTTRRQLTWTSTRCHDERFLSRFAVACSTRFSPPARVRGPLTFPPGDSSRPSTRSTSSLREARDRSLRIRCGLARGVWQAYDTQQPTRAFACSLHARHVVSPAAVTILRKWVVFKIVHAAHSRVAALDLGRLDSAGVPQEFSRNCTFCCTARSTAWKSRFRSQR